MTTMTISQLAHRSGVPATTLRYYEKAGVLPAPPRTSAGYRRYDETALPRVRFLQRAKALGIELDNVAELVRLWDGDRCEPVQDRLREQVHHQQQATRRRLDDLIQLASDLERVGATIGASDACGPDCACLGTTPSSRTDESLPMAPDRRFGAACTLDVAELPQRLAEWRGLRERAGIVDELPGGIRLHLASDESMDAVVRLVTAESECCWFYRFTLTVDGPERSLVVDAGPDGVTAVHVLLGLDR